MSSIRRSQAASAAPPSGDEIDPDRPIENTEQLRIAIDQGHGGDKVDAPDPAAAQQKTQRAERPCLSNNHLCNPLAANCRFRCVNLNCGDTVAFWRPASRPVFVL